MKVHYYITTDKKQPFKEWLDDLRDAKGKGIIRSRIDRLSLGIFGDCRSVGDGVWELKIDFGAGYRVYYAKSGNTIILLLNGGIKKTQQSDINKAKELWADYKARVKKKK